MLLFYVGVAFSYFLVLPMAFAFFSTQAPKGVKIMTDINSFLDFTIGMTLAFGFAFQVPVVSQRAFTGKIWPVHDPAGEVVNVRDAGVEDGDAHTRPVVASAPRNARTGGGHER